MFEYWKNKMDAKGTSILLTSRKQPQHLRLEESREEMELPKWNDVRIKKILKFKK